MWIFQVKSSRHTVGRHGVEDIPDAKTHTHLERKIVC